MGRDSTEPTPPEGLPEQLVSRLARLNADELRKTIIHAQELLQSREETGPRIEPNPGEDIVRVTEEDGYTEVVKRTPCGNDCDDCPHGPYLYHVAEERRLDGSETLHWKFIGKVRSDDG